MDSKKIILVAEDEDDNFLLIQAFLKHLVSDIHIIRAKNGFEAIEHCNNQKEIKLVLMDLKMPEMDGFEASKQIKKKHPALKIIAQSSYTEEEKKKKAFNAGCEDYFTKPLSLAKIQNIINKYL